MNIEEIIDKSFALNIKKIVHNSFGDLNINEKICLYDNFRKKYIEKFFDYESQAGLTDEDAMSNSLGDVYAFAYNKIKSTDIEKKIDQNFLNGVKKMINIWFNDTNDEYKTKLYDSAEKHYFERFFYHKDTNGLPFNEAKEKAIQNVHYSIFSFSNIRK